MALVNIPQQGTVTAEDPTSRVSGGDVARSADYVAQGAEQLGQGLEQVAVPLAQQAGEQAAVQSVSRDANGNIQMQTPQTSFILGRAGEAYQHAVLSGTVALGQSQTTQDLNQMRVDHSSDPAAFKTAANGYLDDLRSRFGDGALGNTLIASATDLATQHYDGLVNSKATSDVSDAKDSIQAEIGGLRNDLSQLAASGATNAPEFAQKSAQLSSYYDALEANPLFQMPKAVVDNMRTAAANAISGEAILGHVDAVVKSDGTIAAQKQAYDSIDGIQGFSDADRAVAKRLVDARIAFLTNQNSVAIQANAQKMDDARKVIGAGGTLPDAAWNDMRQTAKDTGDTTAVQQFNALEQTNRFHRAMPGLTPDQQATQMGVLSSPLGNEAQAMQYFQSKGWTPAQAAGIVGNLVHESGGKLDPNAINPGDGSDGSNSIGIGQWNAERATALKQFAASQGKPANDYGTQLAFVQHEFETTHSGAADALRATNDVAGATGAVALKYEIPAGSETGVAANVNGWQNRLDQATRLAGGNVSAQSANGVPFTPDELRANPFLGSEALRQVASDQKMRANLYTNLAQQADAQIKNGNTPSPEVFAQLDQLGRTSADPTIQQHYQEHLQTVAAARVAQIASAMPQAEGQAFMDNYSRSVQGADLTHMQIASTAQDIYKRSQDEFKNNPFQYAAKRGIVQPVPPLDFSQPPDALNAALSARSSAASALSVQTGVPQSIVAPNDADAVKTGLAMGSPQASSAFLQSVGQLPPAQMQATLAVPEVKGGILAMAKSGDPANMQSAYSFMDQLQRQNPMTFEDPKLGFGPGALSDLRAWQDKISFDTPAKIANDAMHADDPGTIKGKEALRDQADESLKNVTGKDIVNKFPSTGQRWNPFGSDYSPTGEAPAQIVGALRNDYVNAYRDQFAKTADAGAADKYAMERIGQKWGMSDANGGLVMAYRPNAARRSRRSTTLSLGSKTRRTPMCIK
jgi:hypothetical protein